MIAPVWQWSASQLAALIAAPRLKVMLGCQSNNPIDVLAKASAIGGFQIVPLRVASYGELTMRRTSPALSTSDRTRRARARNSTESLAEWASATPMPPVCGR